MKSEMMLPKSFYFFKILMSILPSILFLPILNIFILALDCTSDIKGILRHTNYNEIICWEQTHIIHSIFGILISIIFTLMVLILSLLNFETKTNSRDINSK